MCSQKQHTRSPKEIFIAWVKKPFESLSFPVLIKYMPTFWHIAVMPAWLDVVCLHSLWVEQVYRIVCAEDESCKQDRDKWKPLKFILFPTGT